MALVRRVCPLGGLRPLRGRSAALRAAHARYARDFHFCVNMKKLPFFCVFLRRRQARVRDGWRREAQAQA